MPSTCLGYTLRCPDTMNAAAMAAKGQMPGPNSSIAITDAASGALAAPACGVSLTRPVCAGPDDSPRAWRAWIQRVSRRSASTVSAGSGRRASGRRGPPRHVFGSSRHQARNVSATLHAWAMQPPGANGASASNTSAIEPTP